MADTQWIENLRKIVLQSMEAGGPCDVLSGTVTADKKIQIDQKTLLSQGQFIVPEHLTDHEVQMIIPEMGETAVTVKQGLKAGQQVLLLQKRGGQQYVLIGRW